MGFWRFLYNENFHCFPEWALEVCPYPHVPRVKRESKYTLTDFVEAAKAMENWVGIEPCSGCLDNRWLDSMALPLADSCSNIQLEEVNIGQCVWTLVYFERTSMTFFPNDAKLCGKNCLKQPNRTSIYKLTSSKEEEEEEEEEKERSITGIVESSLEQLKKFLQVFIYLSNCLA